MTSPAAARLLVVLSAAALALAPGRLAAQSFLDEGIRWVVDDSATLIYSSTDPDYFRIGGDSAVGGIGYRVVERAEVDGGTFAPTDILIREDGAGRVYYRRGEREGLAYDFTLTVGDTLRAYNPLFPDSTCAVTVLATGDTTLPDGIARRTYAYFNGESAHYRQRRVTIVEGVGNLLDGLFGVTCTKVIGSELLCFLSAAGVSQVGAFGCSYVSAGEVRAARAGEVYPSPFAARLTLAFPDVGPGARYTLADARGAVVASGVLPQGALTLETSALPAGVYVATVALDDGTRVVARAVKW